MMNTSYTMYTSVTDVSIVAFGVEHTLTIDSSLECFTFPTVDSLHTDVFFVVSLGELSLMKNTSVVYVIMLYLRCIHRIPSHTKNTSVTDVFFVVSLGELSLPMYSSVMEVYYEEYRCINRIRLIHRSPMDTSLTLR